MRGHLRTELKQLERRQHFLDLVDAVDHNIVDVNWADKDSHLIKRVVDNSCFVKEDMLVFVDWVELVFPALFDVYLAVFCWSVARLGPSFYAFGPYSLYY